MGIETGGKGEGERERERELLEGEPKKKVRWGGRGSGSGSGSSSGRAPCCEAAAALQHWKTLPEPEPPAAPLGQLC